MQEIWKSLKGIVEFGDNYEISNLGNVRNSVNGKLRSLNNDKDGYLLVTLYKSNKPKTYKVHRLVALSFINNKDDKPLVNHKDGNKSNNYFDNLEWSTSAENNQHARDNKLNKGYDMSGENHPSAKLNEDNVREIRKMYDTGNYSYRDIGNIFGVDRTMIYSIVKYKNWKHVV